MFCLSFDCFDVAAGYVGQTTYVTANFKTLCKLQKSKMKVKIATKKHSLES